MEIIKFSTNIDSKADRDSVSHLFQNEKIIHRWHIDPHSPQHILSVSGNELDPQRIKNLVAQAGFEAEIIRVEGISGSGL